MSQERQARFEEGVARAAAAAAAADALNLRPPRFERSGFITRAFLEGAGGCVELCCGPPDYAVEVFINTAADGRRWTLADLMQMTSVNRWLIENRPGPGEHDEAYALRFVSQGLRSTTDFAWLQDPADR